MKTILVTGAEGFVGTHLIQYLKQRGYEVVGGVRNRARKLTLEKWFGKALVCDVADAINVARVIASVRPDGVIHLAGTSRPGEATAEPLTAYQSLVSAWANVLDGVRRTVPRARVLMVSACEVYGNAGKDGRPLAEAAPLQPVNTYGALRAAAESIAHTFYQNFHLNITIARPFHHTGPGQSDQFFYGAVAKQLGRWDVAVDGDQLLLPDLNFKRDVLHVADVVEAYEKLLRDGKPNEVYNVCSGQCHTVRDIVQTMIRTSCRMVTLGDLPGPGAAAEDAIPCLCGDNSKLRKELNWQPKHSMEEAIRDLIRSYQPAPATVAS